MIPLIRRLAFLILTALVLLPVPVHARLVGQNTARTAAADRLMHHVLEFGDWAGESNPQIITEEIVSSGETVVGYNFLISPKGHILIPADDLLPPVKLESDESTLSFGMNGEGDEEESRSELRAWITDTLYQAIVGLEGFNAPLAELDENIREAREQLWTLYITDTPIFQDALGEFGDNGALTGAGPLLKTSWGQDDPYNLYNPKDRDQCRTRAGQAPMALAQAMKYFEYPEQGRGEHTYSWEDGSRIVTLRRNFAESRYFWDYMPPSGSSSSNEEEQTALAGAALDSGVALSTQFGCESSKASILQAPAALQEYFGYEGANLISRGDFASDADWLRTLAGEFSAGRPVLYEAQSSTGELLSATADGYRTTPDMIHLNVALDRNYRGWFAPDFILLGGSNPADIRNHRAVIGLTPPVLGPFPISPRPGSIVRNATLKLVFGEPPGNDYTHYNVWIKGTNGPIFDDWALKEDICAPSNCSVIPTVDLPAPGEYQWAVRGYRDEEGSTPGPWSEPAGLTALGPDIPTPIAPSGNITSAPVSFVWSPVNGSGEYALQISSGNSSLPEIMISSAESCRNSTCTAILENLRKGSYSWTITAHGIGSGLPAPVTEFTVLNNPLGSAGNATANTTSTLGEPGNFSAPPPVPYSPEAGETVHSQEPAFTWLPVPNATQYLLKVIGPLGLVQSPVRVLADNVCTDDLCAAELNTTLSPDGNYTWGVRAGDGKRFTPPVEPTLFFVQTGIASDTRFKAASPENATMKPVPPPSNASTAAPSTSVPTSPDGSKGFFKPGPNSSNGTVNTPHIRTMDPDAPVPIEDRPKKILNIRKRGREIEEDNASDKPLLRITS